jgi:carbon monoxide dehydrogenase subunit G
VRDFTTSIEIAATPARVWDVLSDVERWHDWTPSIERITPLDDAPLGVGSKVRIEQPKLRPATWKITSWEPGRGFSWESAGARIRGAG